MRVQSVEGEGTLRDGRRMRALQPIRILIADDHTLVREGLTALLAQQENIAVVAHAQSGREAIALFRQHRPDIVLMDLRMPDIDGIEATEALCQEFPGANIIVLTLSHAEEDVYRALSAGAKAYLLKETPSAELMQTLFDVMAGHTVVPPGLALRLAERLRRRELTTRETEVLHCIAQGMTNAQIAAHLFVSEGTVKSHINNMLVKLQTSDRTGALIAGLKRGLIRLE